MHADCDFNCCSDRPHDVEPSGALADLHTFVVAQELVTEINSNLSLNPAAGSWSSLVTANSIAHGPVMHANKLYLTEKLGPNLANAASAQNNMKQQVSVSALCVGIYVTTVGNSATSTKLSSIRQAKRCAMCWESRRSCHFNS